MFNRTLKTNVEPRWPLKSNLELRWPPFVCHVIWAVFVTRNARTFVRSADSEPFVRRTSRMKKRAYERILTFGTAQSNTPTGETKEFVTRWWLSCFLILYSLHFRDDYCLDGQILSAADEDAILQNAFYKVNILHVHLDYRADFRG